MNILFSCSVCGTSLEKPIIFMTENHTNLMLCQRCVSMSGTCYFCIEGVKCAFEQSNINIPKVETVMARTPRGQVQATIKNRARVEATCKKCSCWNSEDECCNKEVSTCGNYKIKY